MPMNPGCSANLSVMPWKAAGDFSVMATVVLTQAGGGGAEPLLTAPSGSDGNCTHSLNTQATAVATVNASPCRA